MVATKAHPWVVWTVTVGMWSSVDRRWLTHKGECDRTVPRTYGFREDRQLSFPACAPVNSQQSHRSHSRFPPVRCQVNNSQFRLKMVKKSNKTYV